MNTRKLLVAVLCLGVCGSAFAVGAADAAISAGADDAVATWTVIKGLMIPIGVFALGYAFFKRLKRA